MWDIDRIVIQGGVLMAMLTNARCDADANTQVFLVTANTGLHTHRLSSLGEFGFHELGHRMSVVWICVTCQTLFVTGWRVDEMTC